MNTNRRILLMIVILLAVLVVVVISIRIITTSTIAISAPTGTDIYVKQASKSGFVKIGTGAAVFKTRSTGPVYVQIQHGEQVSQKTVSPIRRKSVKVSLDLKPLATLTDIANGPIIYPLITDQFVYGINPHTNGLSVILKNNSNQPLPLVPLLPYLRQLIWLDNESFLYVTDSGSGVTDLAMNSPNQSLPYTEAVKAGDSVAVLGGDGLALVTGSDFSHSTSLASIINNSSPSVFADTRGFYFVSLIYQDRDVANPPAEKTKLTVFDLNGKKLSDLSLPITETAYKVMSIDKTTLAILSSSGLTFVDIATQHTQLKRFSFGNVQDITEVNGKLLLLGSSGLWQFDPTTGISYRLSTYPSGEEYIPNSLTFTQNSLYFSSSITDQALKDSASNVSSRFYQVQLP